MITLISLNEAARKGIQHVRRRHWANALDHVKLDIIEGRLGPWLHLYSPVNMEINGRDPVDSFTFEGDLNEEVWVEYRGPLADSVSYKTAAPPSPHNSNPSQSDKADSN